MQKKALLLSAGEYIDSQEYPKPSLDLNGVKYDRGNRRAFMP